MFKVLIFVSVVFTANAHTTGPNTRVLEDAVIETLECIRGVLKSGIEEVGLPSLEPIVVEELHVNVSDLGINSATGFVNVKNGIISGVTNWELSDLKIKLSFTRELGVIISAKVNLPLLLINTEYETNLNTSGINVFGAGEIELTSENLNFDLVTRLVLNNFTPTKFRLSPHIENLKMNITGFLNDEEHSQLVSSIVNELGVTWINEKSEKFADVIEEFVLSLFNSFILRLLIPSVFDFNDIVNAILEKCSLPIQ